MKEETIIDQTMISEESCENQTKGAKKVGNGVKMGAAIAAGTIAGSAATFGGQAVAANLQQDTPEEAEGNVTNTPTGTSGAHAAVSGSAPIAHVSDEMTFSEAFASARQQVGPGGVFEWHGKVYGTYYKNEWDNMSADEKADYQASIEIDHTPANEAVEQTNELADNSEVSSEENKDETADISAQNTSAEANDAADADIHVISVEHDVNMNGHDVDVAVIEVDGHQGLLVDVSGNGEVDGAIVDFNDNGQVEQNEVSPDLSGQHIPMPQMNDGDAYMVQNDDMPDYTNDAIV